ncbi:MAG: ABC transporter ATP-binding protein [Fibrella sp.]|nr:ABC transporter ATP-binding protein [Armatimonadota bacterium]
MSLQIENLTKTYPNGVRALNGVSLTIERGLFGLLGPNGAGKSSLMRTIATLQDPDSGSIRLGELDVLRDKDRLRQRLGYLPQDFGFYPTLSAEATLEHFAALKRIPAGKARREAVQYLLQQVNLYDVRNKNVGGFSGGMRQRLGVAVALIGSPELVIVDEPTAGLDPTERHRFLNLLSEVGENVIVILSTHIVEDVRELCERTAIIAKGRVIAQGNPEDVIAGVGRKIYKRVFDKAELAEAQTRYHVVSTRLIAGKPVMFIYSETEPGDGFVPVEADLEDAYFYYTGIAAGTQFPTAARQGELAA